jgi:hypothetical protein
MLKPVTVAIPLLVLDSMMRELAALAAEVMKLHDAIAAAIAAAEPIEGTPPDAPPTAH